MSASRMHAVAAAQLVRDSFPTATLLEYTVEPDGGIALWEVTGPDGVLWTEADDRAGHTYSEIRGPSSKHESLVNPQCSCGGYSFSGYAKRDLARFNWTNHLPPSALAGQSGIRVRLATALAHPEDDSSGFVLPEQPGERGFLLHINSLVAA